MFDNYHEDHVKYKSTLKGIKIKQKNGQYKEQTFYTSWASQETNSKYTLKGGKTNRTNSKWVALTVLKCLK